MNDFAGIVLLVGVLGGGFAALEDGMPEVKPDRTPDFLEGKYKQLMFRT